MYEAQATEYYANDKRLPKAIAAGIAMDNALKLEYTKGGHTKTHFMMSNYLKYFSYEALQKIKIHEI